MKILVADDDEWTLRLLEKLIGKAGHDVVTARDGLEAWELFEQHEFACVVSDWMMPGMEGPQLVEKIRAKQLRYYVYVILVTARSEHEDMIAGMEAGADDFLCKPINRDELRVGLRVAQRILDLEMRLAQRNEQLEALNNEISATNRRMKADLEAGAKVQRALLPTLLPNVMGLEFAFSFRPCDELAGDILNIFPLDDEHVGMYILDVSGHGVAAALLSVTLSRLLSPIQGNDSILLKKEFDPFEPRFLSPAAVARELNRRFAWDATVKQYFTFLYGVLSWQTLEFRYVSAGHPGPCYIPTGGEGGINEHPAFPIGMIAEATYTENCIQMQPGDRIYLYSDGVTETANAQKELFDKQRLIKTLEEARELPLNDSLDRLEAALAAWRNGERVRDDESILAIEVKLPEAVYEEELPGT